MVWTIVNKNVPFIPRIPIPCKPESNRGNINIKLSNYKRLNTKTINKKEKEVNKNEYSQTAGKEVSLY